VYYDIIFSNFKVAILFAEFNASAAGQYVFTHGGNDYVFVAEEGSHIVFDPENGVMSGEQATLYTYDATLDGDFIIELDENGLISGVDLEPDGVYIDTAKGLHPEIDNRKIKEFFLGNKAQQYWEISS